MQEGLSHLGKSVSYFAGGRRECAAVSMLQPAPTHCRLFQSVHMQDHCTRAIHGTSGGGCARAAEAPHPQTVSWPHQRRHRAPQQTLRLFSSESIQWVNAEPVPPTSHHLAAGRSWPHCRPAAAPPPPRRRPAAAASQRQPASNGWAIGQPLVPDGPAAGALRAGCRPAAPVRFSTQFCRIASLGYPAAPKRGGTSNNMPLGLPGEPSHAAWRPRQPPPCPNRPG